MCVQSEDQLFKLRKHCFSIVPMSFARPTRCQQWLDGGRGDVMRGGGVTSEVGPQGQ